MKRILQVMSMICILVTYCCHAYAEEPISPPAGVPEEVWEMTYTDVSKVFQNYPDSVKNLKKNVTVVRTDSEFFIKGVISMFPDAWIKGIINENTVTFPKNQMIGTYNYGNEGRLMYKSTYVYARTGEGEYTLAENPPYFDETVKYNAVESISFTLQNNELIKPDAINCIWADSPYCWPFETEPSFSTSIRFEYGARDKGYDPIVYYYRSYTDYYLGGIANFSFKKVSQ